MKRFWNSCRTDKNNLNKQIPASVVGGQRNCIKHIWGIEPIWLMDVGYAIFWKTRQHALQKLQQHRPPQIITA